MRWPASTRRAGARLRGPGRRTPSSEAHNVAAQLGHDGGRKRHAAAARRGIGRTLVELSQNLDHDVGHPKTAGMQVEVGRSQSKAASPRPSVAQAIVRTMAWKAGDAR